MLAALLAWSFVRDVGAQGVCAWLCGEFCESLDDTYPDDAPWHLERSRDEGEQCWCECCDALRRISYQARFPNATAIPATATLEPTSTATDTPTSTATRRPPTAVPTAIPATATPEPTFTRVNTPTPTLEPKWTITPHIPVPPASPTMTPAASPTSSQTSTASPTVGETPTPEIVAQPETILPAAPMRRPVMLPCLPKHAARPVALCETRSGSGWWLYFIGPGGARGERAARAVSVGGAGGAHRFCSPLDHGTAGCAELAGRLFAGADGVCGRQAVCFPHYARGARRARGLVRAL